MNSSETSRSEDVCPICGNKDVLEQWETQLFHFGAEKPVELRAVVPVLTCQSCGFSYTDDRAESIRHDEACRHQGLITSREVRQVREDVYAMSRREFEKHFGVSEASLERWENRKLFPSKQVSIYLRLLMDPVIGRRAMEWQSTSVSEISVGSIDKDQFPMLKVSAELLHRAQEFKLRPTVH